MPPLFALLHILGAFFTQPSSPPSPFLRPPACPTQVPKPSNRGTVQALDLQGSDDSLVDADMLAGDAMLRLEKEKAEREREWERVQRERSRVEKDKALLGLSRASIMSMEEGSRPVGEVNH